MSLRLLFVCSRNRQRSPTAEAVFARYEGVETQSAGTSDDADCALSGDAIEWADVIFVMEAVHRDSLSRRFGRLLRGKRIVVLGIPDHYAYMQPELVALLEARVRRAIALP
jgi:predicted protein tyrosine phosphatase